MAKKYVVCLSAADRCTLTALLTEASLRRKRRARLLLDADSCADGGGLSDHAISARWGVSVPTVARLRQKYAAGGLDAVLTLPPSPYQRQPGLSAEQAAQLRNLAAGPPPAGSRRWSLRQLAEAMVARQYVTTISHETVRRVLKAGPPAAAASDEHEVTMGR